MQGTAIAGLEMVPAQGFAGLVDLSEELGTGYVCELIAVDFAKDYAGGIAVKLGKEVFEEVGHGVWRAERWVL